MNSSSKSVKRRRRKKWWRKVIICPRKNQQPTGVDYYQMPNDANHQNLWKTQNVLFISFVPEIDAFIEHNSIFFFFSSSIYWFFLYLVPDAYNANISKTKTKTTDLRNLLWSRLAPLIPLFNQTTQTYVKFKRFFNK